MNTVAPHPFYAIWERRPFMSVSAATLILENSELDIRHMIESGELPYAINIAQPRSTRKCIRVLTSSVFEVRSKVAIKETEWSAVVASILPKLRDNIISTEIARMLHCDTDLIPLLIKGKCFKLAHPRKNAANEPYTVTMSSFAQFLIERRTY